ncbi:MlaD family protein [Roseovarius dicentrarchi]|uniref:MlaD family protein n=1 Tax=Roseovarius dicentrarchi TaxID=2250573 RepID=UPI000DE8B8F2|nr:MlaD family protein [Roseovarius dicentrarchi]
METRANFILIGAFTLLGIIGSLVFAIWLSSVQLDRQYSQYGILFEDVSGLPTSGDVVFNGINVGRVIELYIYEPDPSKVYVGIEVDAETPVNENTVAQLSSSGVTGVAYISLSSKGGEAAPLTSDDGTPPIIPSRRSTVQQLVEDAPDLIAEATDLLKRFQVIAGPENQALVQNILTNLSTASGGLESALTDFSSITKTVSEATQQISGFSERLETLGAAAEETLANVDRTLSSATGAFDTANEVIGNSSAAIDSAGAAFAEAETLMRDQVPGIAAQISETITALNTAVTDISQRTAGTLDGFDQTATLLNARLTELETTLADASTGFEAITTASNSVNTLVAGDGTLMVADAREVLAGAKSTIAGIETVIDTDVPAVVSDIRGAVSTASAAIDQVARDLAGFTDRLDPLANDTRTAVNAATADIRAATGRIGTAAQQVSDDLPQITADLRGLISRADNVVAQVQRITADAAPGIRNFTGNGLNELGRLSGEARTLVQSLERLVRRIGNDPARFLLDERVPEYRR